MEFQNLSSKIASKEINERVSETRAPSLQRILQPGLVIQKALTRIEFIIERAYMT